MNRFKIIHLIKICVKGTIKMKREKNGLKTLNLLVLLFIQLNLIPFFLLFEALPETQ